VRLIEHFIAGTTARAAARFCGLHRNTAAYYFLRLREIIAYELEAEIKAMFGGEIEVDESYFGGASWSRIASCIPTAGAAIIYGMCQTSITSVSTILSSSQTATITSMALRISGTRPSATCVNSTVFQGAFWVFLKECKWRFNNSDPSAQLSQLRQWVRRYLN